MKVCSDKRTDPRVLEVIRDALLVGNTCHNAACLAGISEKTFDSWMAEGASAPEASHERKFFDLVVSSYDEATERFRALAAKHAKASVLLPSSSR